MTRITSRRLSFSLAHVSPAVPSALQSPACARPAGHRKHIARPFRQLRRDDRVRRLHLALPLRLAKHIPALHLHPLRPGKFNRRRHTLPLQQLGIPPKPAAYVITPFVSFTGFIIANSFPPIDLSAAQNRTYVLHASVSATCGSFNSIARIRSVSIVVENPTADL